MSVDVAVEELRARLEALEPSPADAGTVELVVRRPGEGLREVLEEGVLDVAHGLVGDDWEARERRRDRWRPETQLTLMNARVIQLIAGDRSRWPLAGDQLYVDLDLAPENLPLATRLSVGTAIVEVTDVPHTGCAKFTERFGHDAIRLVNSPQGRAERLRGMYVRVVQGGVVRPGDAIAKL